MSLRSALLGFRAVSLLFTVVFVLSIFEFLGMAFYLAFTDQDATFRRLVEAGFAPGVWVEFLLASPERIAVAVGLALVGLLLVASDARRRNRIRLNLGD